MQVTEFLKTQDFGQCHHSGYDLVKRVDIIHYLFWSEQLKHFGIGVFNESAKGKAGGGTDRWNIILLPKPIYTSEQADELIKSITKI